MQYRRWRETGFQSSVDYPSVNSTGQLTANPVIGYRTMTTIMSELQILQNKAAKVLLGHPPRSSSTEALRNLDLKSLSARRFFHRCIAIHKCLIGETDFNFNFIKNQAVHSYNTRRSNDLRLPLPRTNWGKHIIIIIIIIIVKFDYFSYYYYLSLFHNKLRMIYWGYHYCYGNLEIISRSVRQLSLVVFKPLLVAYQKDPFKILSIYVYRFSANTLKNRYQPFESLSNWQIRKAPSTSGEWEAWSAIENIPRHTICME